MVWLPERLLPETDWLPERLLPGDGLAGPQQSRIRGSTDAANHHLQCHHDCMSGARTPPRNDRRPTAGRCRTQAGRSRTTSRDGGPTGLGPTEGPSRSHRGTAAYRHWRQRYTLEPRGVEQLVWICLNVCLATICLTVPLTVVTAVGDVAKLISTDNSTMSDDFVVRMTFVEAVCTQAEYCCFSLKIFVYVASSSRFRHELRSTFRLEPCAHPRRSAAAATESQVS